MKVTYNWLKDFVDIRLTPKALAEKLTGAGLEVTSLENIEDDFVFEIEITSNRPDWLSVVGIAREIGSSTGKKLKSGTRTAPGPIGWAGVRQCAQEYKSTSKGLQQKAGTLELKIENKKDCPLYTAKIIGDVKVGSSAEWLKKRLELIGCRTVNNIVDITNYCLFTWGEPLHAFDLDKLSSGSVFVRRAVMNEKLVTIDGQVRTLSPEMLVIADSKAPVALAGIMGGKDTEVTVGTKNILLEAAVFDPIVLRRARRLLGLQTDSSYRFERGIDLETAERASWQAVRLIEELAGGRFVTAKNSGLTRPKAVTVSLNLSRAQGILNSKIAPPRIKNILNALGFTVKGKGENNFSVTVPPHRPDVRLEADLIEEIARIFGYEKISISVPSVRPQPSINEKRDRVSLIKNLLTGLGLNEVVTYSLVDRDLLRGFAQGLEEGAVGILNPLSKEQEVLRPSLLPSLARCTAYNLNQKQEYVNIFEIANIYLGGEGAPKEELMLAVALCGSKPLMLEQGPVRDRSGFLHLKGVLEALFKKMGIADYDFVDSKEPLVKDIRAGQEKIGRMMMLRKPALDKFDIKNKDVFMLELFLERVFPAASFQKKFTSPPRYPGIDRDISFILKEDVPLKEVLTALKAEGGSLLREIRIVDYYQGKQIPAGYRGLTISCLYRSDQKTLVEDEVNPLHASLNRVLVERFSARIR